MNTKLNGSEWHEMPSDMEKIILDNDTVLQHWSTITPLAQNEWICWVTIPKKPETRQKRLQRFPADMLEGKKRPCCWPGCPHRRHSAKKWFK